MSNPLSISIGLVAIGRNEGERLRACLTSVVHKVMHVVYVDSGSNDDSVAMAEAMGAHVVKLDMSVPFTAARARNAGWRALLSLAPELEYVQFVDGDCVIADGWLEAAAVFLQEQGQYGVVAGRLRERAPELSVYNRLCDIEWDTPVGDAMSCGGIAVLRVSALKQVGGFRDDLIAGEEPEMCVRLRQTGWKIRRIEHDMAWHDAAMTRFGQWWRRTVRCGHGYAEGSWLHGALPERHWAKETARALIWGAVLPLLILLLALLWSPWFLLMVFAYPLQVWRLSRGAGGWMRAFFLVLGKFAESWGAIKYYRRILLRRKRTLIEYK